MFVIDHENYGCRTEFDTLEKAEAALHDCGEGFEDISLDECADGRVINERGECVGWRVGSPADDSNA